MQSRKGWALGLTFGLLVSLVVADSIFLPFAFASGTPARASEVNQNFVAIAGVVNGNLDAGNVRDRSLFGTDLALATVGTNELQEFVIFGNPGFGGNVMATNSAGSIKSQLTSSTETGGYVDVKNESNFGVAVQLATPAGFGDGGLLTVFTSGGTIAAQLQPDGDIFKIGNNGFVHPHPADPEKQIVYMSLEGGERGTYFRGEGRLLRGRCVIEPPEHWRLVTAKEGITVQVTPAGNCAGLYVESAGLDEIRFVELAGGLSDATFYYQVNGVRAGFEDHQVIEPNTMFLPDRDLTAEDGTPSGVRAALVSNGILNPDGTRNAAVVERLRAAAKVDEAVRFRMPQEAPQQQE